MRFRWLDKPCKCCQITFKNLEDWSQPRYPPATCWFPLNSGYILLAWVHLSWIFLPHLPRSCFQSIRCLILTSSRFFFLFFGFVLFFLDSWEESLLCGMALAVSPIPLPVVMIHKEMEMIYKNLPNGPEAFGAALSRDTSEMQCAPLIWRGNN